MIVDITPWRIILYSVSAVAVALGMFSLTFWGNFFMDAGIILAIIWTEGMVDRK